MSGLRFLDAHDGWAFGPELWVTHNGGANWAQESTYGLRVTSLETAGDRAFALFADCAGNGADFAARCASFRLYSSGAGSDRWQPVPGAASDLRAPGNAAGRAATASLVLAAGPVTDPAGGTGYLLAPSGAVLSGPLAGGPWTVERIYELFPRLAERKQNRGRQLSGGEQEMLSIARALLLNPRLLILDEPSQGLAPLIVREVFRIVQQMKAEGISVLLVEQNARMSLEIADDAYVLDDGAVVYSGTARELAADDARVRALAGASAEEWTLT